MKDFTSYAKSKDRDKLGVLDRNSLRSMFSLKRGRGMIYNQLTDENWLSEPTLIKPGTLQEKLGSVLRQPTELSNLETRNKEEQ